jgi:mannose/fructose/N-acetylgalactosamine-specific phosphotransferase system component IIB
MIPTLEEKQHMLDLVEEIRGIVLNVSNLKSREDKLKAAKRMEVIKEEMKEFRRRYPNA